MLEAAEADLALEAGFVHVIARQAFPEIGRQVRRREQTAFRASRWRRRSCRALPDAPAPPKLRDRMRRWDVEFESGLLQQTVSLSPAFLFEGRKPRLSARLCAAGLTAGSERRGRLSIARQPAAMSLSGHIPVPQCR
jgi:hypothetical protein